MSLLDCLLPQVPPVVRDARLVRGPASIPVFESETAARSVKAVETAVEKSVRKLGRPRQYEAAASDPDLHAVVAYLRTVGAANELAVVTATGIPAPKIRYLLHAARALGLASSRKRGMWAGKGGA